MRLPICFLRARRGRQDWGSWLVWTDGSGSEPLKQRERHSEERDEDQELLSAVLAIEPAYAGVTHVYDIAIVLPERYSIDEERHVVYSKREDVGSE